MRDLAPLFTLCLCLSLCLFLASLILLPFQRNPSATYTVTLLSLMLNGSVAIASYVLKRRHDLSKGQK